VQDRLEARQIFALLIKQWELAQKVGLTDVIAPVRLIGIHRILEGAFQSNGEMRQRVKK
jgi:hypothetical protein